MIMPSCKLSWLVAKQECRLIPGNDQKLSSNISLPGRQSTWKNEKNGTEEGGRCREV